MSYEITFIGTSGGPLESGNCSILVKPASLTYSQVLQGRDRPLFMIDAGSGWHALAETILRDRTKSGGSTEAPSRFSTQMALYEDCGTPQEYLQIPHSQPFLDLKDPPLIALRRVFSKVAAMLLSHPHMDHVKAMVINLAGFSDAGEKTVIYASKFTTDALNKHVFNGVMWPDMVLLGLVDLRPIPERGVLSMASGAYSVKHFDLSHGSVVNNGQYIEPYMSLAFLVCDNTSRAKMLIFGDFEADSILRLERNSLIWMYVAPFVLDGSLKCVILECSTHSREPGINLYGHMTPQHVMAELQRLETACAQTNEGSATAPFVRDLKVIVTHVKETYDGKDPRRRIMKELCELNDTQGLRLSISIATNGVLVVV
ncbi:cyclic-AMP phosphodiesterase [Metschnikowia bicuspidata var. bicuspidata NRRL YB-4993]|uniref:Cyclic-AMP phosphodiesterase n=1 Tax=Metschnikowia bicuspidata var. bicuspidata NRRL YB-4993 TaxID=869754 RepID=A0A1A0HE29_9ASCO|nr:cyclic-AMP phosphodiesterase [Metschnikowia bicuspidata var. bicuspidata NRRL YB-4993]OBA22158.1 cyclic-AMP phosphodiesterase [Metschnikowia bicuspidata var. bicuspidata NRRL YB-4993]